MNRATIVFTFLLGSAGASTVLGQGPSHSVEVKLLVIEAEDLGMAHSIDKATFEALNKGWVTSAGILTPAPWYPEVAFWANQHRQADLGVQLDLTSDWKSYCWRAVSPQARGGTLIKQSRHIKHAWHNPNNRRGDHV